MSAQFRSYKLYQEWIMNLSLYVPPYFPYIFHAVEVFVAGTRFVYHLGEWCTLLAWAIGT